MSTLTLIVVLVICWALPLYGVVYNQIHPGYESGLAVAYGFLLGCGIHVLMLLSWVAITRSRLRQPELIIFFTSLCVMILLTAISNGGSLSKINP